MKQKNNSSYTIFDAAYEPVEEEKGADRTAQKSVLAVALILAVLGLAIFIFPVTAGTGLAFLITVGLFLYGLSQSILFFRLPKELRNSWALANGILLLIASGILLTGALMSTAGVLQMIMASSFLVGVLTASIGLSQLAAALSEAPKTPGRGWTALGGSLNVLLSLFMCVNPIFSWFALATVWGIYLMTAAIVLLLGVWSTRVHA